VIELTPELASKMLDRFGPVRHFVPLNESPTTPELLRLLRHKLNSRVKWVAKAAGFCESDVRAILSSLLATKPSEPEDFE
jgi:hypothetical protein